MATVASTNLSPVALATPTTAPAGTGSTTGGTLAAGTHTYAYTNVDAAGNETPLSPTSAGVTTTGATSSVALTGIAAGPTGTASRKVYRNDGAAWGVIATIANNTATTYTDTGTALGATPPDARLQDKLNVYYLAGVNTDETRRSVRETLRMLLDLGLLTGFAVADVAAADRRLGRTPQESG